MRLIDADKLLIDVYTVKKGNEFPYKRAYAKLLNRIENAPTVEAEPVRHGHWKITDRDVMGCNKYTCSVCGHDTEGWKATHYCSNCGAKMDEEVGNE